MPTSKKSKTTRRARLKVIEALTPNSVRAFCLYWIEECLGR
jgi:hypothetical protein